mmetsp:Transcript_9972/g.13328  ORF Transcript_9972/g.13328 Transcript_9972/m.13328 type:complete len:96 (-) Transcript_9972:159-446(-)
MMELDTLRVIVTLIALAQPVVRRAHQASDSLLGHRLPLPQTILSLSPSTSAARTKNCQLKFVPLDLLSAPQQRAAKEASNAGQLNAKLAHAAPTA